MDDQGINKWLESNYGTTTEGLSLFRLVWSDKNLREYRFSEFHDYYGDIFLRAVRETREVLSYPFAQNRWVIEKIKLIDKTARDLGLQTDKQYAYDELYIFQDREGNALELNQHKVEEAIYLYFKYYLEMIPKDRADMRMQMLANREIEKKKITKEIIGNLIDPAPHSIVFTPFDRRRK